MIALACAALMTVAATSDKVAEARHALRSGRLEQARLLIGQAAALGAGRPVERLLADYALARGQYEEALARYELLSQSTPDTEVLELASMAALQLDKTEVAQRFAQLSAASGKASWRTWNVQGVLADRRRDFPAADAAYAKALSAAPGQVEVLNNMGWSQTLRGNWQTAQGIFDEAYRRAPDHGRLNNNRDLVRAALATQLPVRRAGESVADWAARLNDAGVAADLRGEKKRAAAAFATAVEARPEWYERADNNLLKLEAAAAE